MTLIFPNTDPVNRGLFLNAYKLDICCSKAKCVMSKCALYTIYVACSYQQRNLCHQTRPERLLSRHETMKLTNPSHTGAAQAADTVGAATIQEQIWNRVGP